MATRDELPGHVKREIVQRLACYETPSQVAAAVKEVFGLTVTRQRVHYYDPTSKMGAALPAELKTLFEASRKAFLENVDAIPITNKAVRLAKLNRMADLAESRGQIPLVMALCETAAKEMGDAFTNKRDLNHRGAVDIGVSELMKALDGATRGLPKRG